MYLIDTNIWLERLLNQEKSDEVGQFLRNCRSSQLVITDFSFHSIAIILTRLKKNQSLVDFVQDVFIDGATVIVHLEPEDTTLVLNAMEEFNLDFDDAYQYVAANKHDLVIVSLDQDFDRTELGRKKPLEIKFD